MVCASKVESFYFAARFFGLHGLQLGVQTLKDRLFGFVAGFMVKATPLSVLG